MGANVCDDTHDYMQRAVELVRAPPAREDVRRTFLTSPVCDAARHVRKIEDAYMEMVK
jgi:predicted O-linked N-acetylglucosamine transferase (SPINDLY family)